jgi:tRNA-dihydrouridine synthase A
MTSARPYLPVMTSRRQSPNRRLSVAPMMDRTDRHCRVFLRLVSARALLYTEMIPTGAILRGDRARFLDFDAAEHPVALQLGGADPAALAECTAIAEDWGYDEVNLNVGCPSDRVQNARFGACLMAKPETVAAAVTAMQAAARLPVTVKCRVGIDDRDAYEDLAAFVGTVADAGCTSFAIHARKAWLNGLSPKENREVPPLRYADVYRLKADFPALEIVINGGIESLDAAEAHLAEVDGAMIGRAAYQNPMMLAKADGRLFGVPGAAVPERHQIAARLIDYAATQLDQGVYLSRITRHILGLYAGVPGARAWRRHLSTHAHKPGAGVEVIEQALALAEDERAARLQAA